jgi:hypothetical protein
MINNTSTDEAHYQVHLRERWRGGANSSHVKQASPKKGHVDAFGGVVTQRKTQSPPASPARKVNAETWTKICGEEAQEDYMHSSLNILMEVDSAQADGNQ